MIPVSPKTWQFVIHYLLGSLMVAPVAAYLWSRIKGRYQRPEWLPLFAGVQVFELAGGIFFTTLAVMQRNNQWFGHIGRPIVFIGLLLVLFQLGLDRLSRRILYAISLGVGLLAAGAGAFLNGLEWRNSLFTTTQSLVFMSLGTIEFRRMLTVEDDTSLTDRPEFWLLAALLIYASGTLIFNASSNYFLRTLPPHLVLIPWVAAAMVHAAYHLLLAKVFLCPKPSSS